MRRAGLNDTLIVILMLVAITGTGMYLTYFKMPSEIRHLEETRNEYVRRMRELEQLRTELAEALRENARLKQTWRARYRFVPTRLGSGELIDRLNALMQEGFYEVSIRYTGSGKEGNLNYVRIEVAGKAHYPQLYRMLWRLENDPLLYRISKARFSKVEEVVPDTKEYRLVVSFSMLVDAFYGMVASADMAAVVDSVRRTLPGRVFPAPSPPINPFWPAVLSTLPPNRENLPEVDGATLLSITGTEAVIRARNGVFRLREGDRVYLGRVERIDPIKQLVRFRMNRGGIIDNVELQLATNPLDMLQDALMSVPFDSTRQNHN